MTIPGWAVLKQAAMDFWADNALSHGAAIAFYTMFSLAPVLFIVIAIAGLAFGRQAAQGAIVGQLSGLMGHQTAAALQTMIKSAYRERTGDLATGVGLVFLTVSATSVFAEMQSALNAIWKAEPTESAVTELVRVRLISLGLVVGLGFVLLASLAVNAALDAIGYRIERLSPGLPFLLRAINVVASFVLLAVLFAAIYKVLPDKRVAWRDAATGGVVAALLFAVGRYLIGFYIGSTAVSSSYGAAGALAVVLLWIYCVAQIFLFGAEFAKAFAKRRRRGR